MHRHPWRWKASPAFISTACWVPVQRHRERLETHRTHLRSINRHQWQLDAPARAISEQDADSRSRTQVFAPELKRTAGRSVREQAAFHPNATQFTLHLGLCRYSGSGARACDRQPEYLLYQQHISNEDCPAAGTWHGHQPDRVRRQWRDLISGYGTAIRATGSIELQPYCRPYGSPTSPRLPA